MRLCMAVPALLVTFVATAPSPVDAQARTWDLKLRGEKQYNMFDLPPTDHGLRACGNRYPAQVVLLASSRLAGQPAAMKWGRVVDPDSLRSRPVDVFVTIPTVGEPLAVDLIDVWCDGDDPVALFARRVHSLSSSDLFFRILHPDAFDAVDADWADYLRIFSDGELVPFELEREGRLWNVVPIGAGVS